MAAVVDDEAVVDVFKEVDDEDEEFDEDEEDEDDDDDEESNEVVEHTRGPKELFWDLLGVGVSRCVVEVGR